MRIIFSRKGFDSGSGGCPSPLMNGAPVSLPIPGPFEPETYADIRLTLPGGAICNLGETVAALTRGRVPATMGAHRDPRFYGAGGDAFATGPVAFGQDGAAQSHLDNQGVSVGDVFLFFGIFKDYTALRGAPNAQPHHRIFGWMLVAQKTVIGDRGTENLWRELGLAAPHPHTRPGTRGPLNTLWQGIGKLAATSPDALRLTAPGLAPSQWRVPDWLQGCGLSYHDAPARWAPGRLNSVARGQEFVATLPDDPDHPAHGWLRGIIDAI